MLGAFDHHLQYDGNGYPVLKADWKPNIVSQMIAVSNGFDKLRSGKPDADPASMNMTVKALAQERGTAFHPALVDNFIESINR